MRKENSKTKTIIFDFDGTIADTFEIATNLLVKYASKLGFKNITREDIERFKNSTYKELIDEFEVALVKIPILLKFSKKKMQERIGEVDSFEGIPEVLKDLKSDGFKLGILSSNKVATINRFLENNDLEIFDFVHSESSLFGKHKALKRIIKKHKLDTNEVLYVGDEARDIEGAKKADINVVAVTWGYNTKESLKKHKPDYLIDSPEEIVKIL